MRANEMDKPQRNDDLDPANRLYDQCTVHLEDQQKLLYNNGYNDNKKRIHVEFSDLRYSVSQCKVRKSKVKKKSILRGVYGYFCPGKLTGIIGPSGAGKTSLLGIISGLRASNLKGSITINGLPRNTEEFRKSACYIPQEFALLPRLTTKETLEIAARLKLGPPHTQQSRQFVVNEVANKLGLLNCMDTMTDKLSGGEKKRLSIGVEIITSPAVLLLDEPTSGLDSAASSQVVNVLKNIAKTGCTVVCTIHQPNSQIIGLFDDILILADGRNVYCGPTSDIVDTFKEAGFTCPPFYNIGEFVIEVVTNQRGGDLDLLCKIGNVKCNNNKLKYDSSKLSSNGIDQSDANNSDLEHDYTEAKKLTNVERKSVSSWERQKVLLSRAIICNQRDNTMTKLRLAAHIIIALLLGLVFYDFGGDWYKYQSNVACIFFFLLFLFFANSMPAVQMFPIEAAVFLREHMNNWYSLRSYYIAKVVTDIPLQIICPSCFLIIAYCMTGQPLECERFIRVWLICILMTILAQSLGIVTGAAFDTHAGCFLVPALNIPMLLFAGFFVKLGEVPAYLQPFSWISYFRYGFEGLLQAIYDNHRLILKCTGSKCMQINGRIILTAMDMPSMSYGKIVIALTVWILFLHIIIYSVLRWKLYRATK